MYVFLSRQSEGLVGKIVFEALYENGQSMAITTIIFENGQSRANFCSTRLTYDD